MCTCCMARGDVHMETASLVCNVNLFSRLPLGHFCCFLGLAVLIGELAGGNSVSSCGQVSSFTSKLHLIVGFIAQLRVTVLDFEG